jgi:hypothetical protein
VIRGVRFRLEFQHRPLIFGGATRRLEGGMA